MPHAIRVYETGGPEKMRWEEVEVGAPGPGQVRVRNTAIGLNYIDTYHRSGLYPVPMPAILGSEGAGVVQLALGDSWAFGFGAALSVAIAPRTAAAQGSEASGVGVGVQGMLTSATELPTGIDTVETGTEPT